METPTLAQPILDPKTGQQVDVILTEFIAKRLGVGRIMAGVIAEITPKQIRLKGETVLRPTASGACRRCRRPLSDETSKAIGFGPDCAQALGITNKVFRSWSDVPSKAELDRARRFVAFDAWIPRSQVQFLPPGETLVYETRLRKMREGQAPIVRDVSALKHDDITPVALLVPPGESLYPHQPIGITFALQQGRSLNGDEPGLGKTVQAVYFAQHAYYALRERGRDGKVLYVTLATLKRGVARELARWWPSVRVQVIDHKTDKINRKADVYVINYDILAERAGKEKKLRLTAVMGSILALNPSVMIVDESHRAKSAEANRTYALLRIGEVAEHTLVMSGTLVVNRPRELITQLKIAGVFDRLFPDGELEFKKKYCQAQLKTIFLKVNGRVQTRRVYDDSGADHLDELHEILGQVMIRRKKAEVLVDEQGNQLLPEKQYAIVPVELSNKREYEEYEAAIAAAPPAQRLGMLSHARELVSIGKADASVELAKTLIESGQKVVVASSFIAAQQHLALSVPSSVHILASDSQQVRDWAEQHFASDPAIRAVVLSTRAGGVGLTLHANGACSNLIANDLEWTAADLDQLHDRIHRIGQTAESVTIWTVIAEGTVDDKLLDLVAEKRLVTGQILDGEPGSIVEERIKRETLELLLERVKARKLTA